MNRKKSARAAAQMCFHFIKRTSRMQLPIGSIRKLTGSIYESDEGIQNFFYLQIQELFFSRLKRSAEEDILSSIATERQMCDTQEQNAHLAPASADERPSRRGSSKNEERGTELCVKD